MKRGLTFLIIISLFLFFTFVLFPRKIDYTERVKVFRSLQQASIYRQAIREYWDKTGEFPSSNDLSGQKIFVKAANPDSIVQSIQIGEDGPGVVTITYTNANDPEVPKEFVGAYVKLIPVVIEDSLVWTCESTIPAEFLPPPCQ